MTLPSPERPQPQRPVADVERAVAAFGLHVTGDVTPIGESVLNENFRAETDDGPKFVRFVRKNRPVERVDAEYRLMVFAGERGIPVVLPVLAGEAPYARVAGHLVQVYPWLESRHGGATEADAFALGEMQARIHVALSGYHDDALVVHRKGVDWDTEDAIAVLSRIDDLIRYYPAPSPENLRIQELLRMQLAMLESGEARPATDFAALPRQTCQGDYHNRNVLFRNEGEVRAVVDWEIAAVVPPALELLRAASFSEYLDAPLLQSYLSGYGSVRRLAKDECALAVECWWQSRLHGTWTYRMRFIEGDRRVDRFWEQERSLLVRFADAGYREWLAKELQSRIGQ